MKTDFSQPFEQFNDFGRHLVNTLIELNQVTSSRVEGLMKLNNTVFNDNLESALNHMKTLTSFRTLEDLMSSQSNYLSDTSRKAAENTKKYLDFALEANAEVNGVVQQNVQTFGERNRQSPKKAA